MRKIFVVLATVALFFGACSSGDEESTSTAGGAADEDQGTADDGGADEGSGDPEPDPVEDDDGDDSSDSGDSSDGDAPASSAEDEATLDAALDAVEAEATARGYTSERTPPDDDDSDDDDLEFESAECQEADEVFNRLDEEYPETAASDTLDASRGEFTGPDSVSEELNVEMAAFASRDDVGRAFDALTSVPLAQCMREAFEAESGDGFEMTLDSVDVTEGDRGDREITIALQASFSGGGTTIEVDLLFTFVGVDRFAVFFGSFSSNSAPTADAFALLDTAVAALG